MQSTQRLLQHALRLTLFTREHCSLCVNAKGVLSRVWDKRHFEYKEVDVMALGQTQWKQLYEFDTPVVHFDRTATLSSQNSETTAAARKLMHRFTEEDVTKAMDLVEKQ